MAIINATNVITAALLNSIGNFRIADTTLSVAATNITFNSIPGTYRHLMLIMSGRGDVAATNDDLKIQINGDTGSNYNYQLLNAVNTAASASANIAQAFIRMGTVPGASAAASIAASGFAYFPDYASTTLFKTVKSEIGFADNTAANSFARTIWGTWRSTVAITSIKLFPELSVNLVAGSRMTLYGLN